MLMLTDKAAEILKGVAEGRGLRIGAGSGCSQGYTMGLEDGPAEGDSVLEFHGLQVFVDAASWLRLHGVTVDFVDGPDGGGFKFDGPAAKPAGCSCSTGRCG